MRTGPSTALLLGLPLAQVTGCILYDNNCKDDDFWSDDDTGQAGDDTAELPGDGGGTGDGGSAETDAFWMSPDRIAQGETLIAGLQTDGDLDWSRVVGVEIFGDVTPCAFQARPDELLLTLAADPEAMVGPVDLVLELDDGQGVWIEDALTVVADEAGEDPGTDAGACGG